MPRVRLHQDEVAIEPELVVRLLADQFPHWAGLSLLEVESGTDSMIYRMGSDLAVRLPRIGWARHQVAKEFGWLPRLAPYLPVRVPRPVAIGSPGCGYPWEWLVYGWLDGSSAMRTPIADERRLAVDLAAFVQALHAIDTAGAPSTEGSRGGALVAHDRHTRASIEKLRGDIDANAAINIWETALAAGPWAGGPIWVHGDLLPGNILVTGGKLTGVIDWSAAGAGDPSCDLMIGWSFEPDVRETYFEALEVDDATVTRARGWALSQAVQFIPYYATTIPDGVAAAWERLMRVMA